MARRGADIGIDFGCQPFPDTPGNKGMVDIFWDHDRSLGNPLADDFTGSPFKFSYLMHGLCDTALSGFFQLCHDTTPLDIVRLFRLQPCDKFVRHFFTGKQHPPENRPHPRKSAPSSDLRTLHSPPCLRHTIRGKIHRYFQA